MSQGRLVNQKFGKSRYAALFFFFFGFSHEGKTVNVVKNTFTLPSTAIFEN